MKILGNIEIYGEDEEEVNRIEDKLMKFIDKLNQEKK